MPALLGIATSVRLVTGVAIVVAVVVNVVVLGIVDIALDDDDAAGPGSHRQPAKHITATNRTVHRAVLAPITPSYSVGEKRWFSSDGVSPVMHAVPITR